jgi:predicted DNA-binding transcriptional regulator AlpA
MPTNRTATRREQQREIALSIASQQALLTAHDDTLITTLDAAKLLGVSYQLLVLWRDTGEGPRFVKLSARLVRYRIADLKNYIRRRGRGPRARAGE